MSKNRRVFFHYNKPYSQRSGVDKWSVHFKNTCHIVDKIICEIPTESKNNHRQPRVVMRGMASEVNVSNGIATIRK